MTDVSQPTTVAEPRGHIWDLEERLRLLEGTREAVDIIGLSLTNRHNDAERCGIALITLADRMRDDLTAIQGALSRYAKATRRSHPDAQFVFGIECPSLNGGSPWGCAD